MAYIQVGVPQGCSTIRCLFLIHHHDCPNVNITAYKDDEDDIWNYPSSYVIT